MGGEKHAVLMYGPRGAKPLDVWVEVFGLVNKKQWVREYMAGKPYDPFEVDEIFKEHFPTSLSDLMWDFLSQNTLTYAYANSVDWGYTLVGREVPDYDTFGEEEKQRVREFCLAYGLDLPTFYAAIVGEYA